MESYKFLKEAETSKVQKIDINSVFIIDKVQTPNLYNATIGDEYKLPYGVMVVLKDGEDSQSAIGDGESVFSSSVLLGGGDAPIITADSITDASSIGKTVLKAATAADIRSAIGAGTSNYTLPSGGTNTTFLRGDGTWVTPTDTNTTYTLMTQAEANAGTVNTARTISALVLDTKIKTMVPVAIPALGSAGQVLAVNAAGTGLEWITPA